MIKDIEKITINDENLLHRLNQYGYTGGNRLYDIIEFFESELSVFFNRIVEVDTDDDDFCPKNFVNYSYESNYQISWNSHHTLVETNNDDETSALVDCVKYTISAYDEYMKELDRWSDEENNNTFDLYGIQ